MFSAPHRVWLQQLLRKRRHIHRLLCALNQQDQAVSDTTMLLEGIAAVARRALNPTSCLIWVHEDSGEAAKGIVSWIGVRPPSCLVDGDRQYCRQRRARLVTGLKDGLLRAALLEAGMKLVTPLVYQGELIGWLGVGPPRRGQTYTPEKRCFLEILAHQAALAIYILRLQTKLETSVTQLRRAYQQIIQAQENERRLLAETLHDETLQHLADLSVRLGLLYDQSELNPAIIADLQMRLARADRCLREVIRGVHPAVLSDLGLIEAIIAFLETLPSNSCPSSPIRVELKVIGFGEQRLPDQNLELALYRFTQNATVNALTHAKPGRISIEFNWGLDSVAVQVKDDGCGLKTTVEEAARAGHFGLLTMRERIEALGGKFILSSRPGRGTQIIGRVPLMTSSPAPGQVEGYTLDLI